MLLPIQSPPRKMRKRSTAKLSRKSPGLLPSQLDFDEEMDDGIFDEEIDFEEEELESFDESFDDSDW